MTMSERCLIPYNYQLSAAKFIAQARFDEAGKARDVVHHVQKCSWIEVVVREKVKRTDDTQKKWKYRTSPWRFSWEAGK